MEDRSVWFPQFGRADRSLFGVFDGHGGSEVAEYVAKRLPKEILRLWNSSSAPLAETELPSSTQITEAFFQTDRYLHSKRALAPRISKQGSTAVVALVDRKPDGRFDIVVANIGDSEAFLMFVHFQPFFFVRCFVQTDENPCDLRNSKANGTEELTEDHNGRNPNEVERIQALGGSVFAGRVRGMLAVTRSFGDSMFQEVIVTPHVSRIEGLAPDPHNTLVLASDGVSLFFLSLPFFVFMF
jgi:serine/threonine protein phosphatase PrpC